MWNIKIDPLVFKEDFKKLDRAQQRHILKTIEKKLSIDPEHYGQRLHGEYFGCWRLRIENYRVIYKIVKNEVIVYVIKVGVRKDDLVYKEFFKRLRKLK